jgi:radical SAM superfamily enzyme YgiQ (UPF0313 family)
MSPSALLINPWIYDFAAYDLWSTPLGLLYLSDWLRKAGFDVKLVDCLDRLHPNSQAPAGRKNHPPGSGQYYRRPLPLPDLYKGIPRQYACYGLPEDAFLVDIRAVPTPDLILVTSAMTYWYPGVFRAIELIRSVHREVPIILGGTYATLCHDHAKANSGADMVIAGPGEAVLPDIIRDTLGLDISIPASPWYTCRPDLSLYPKLEFAPLMTSRGCPGRCPYCASQQLHPGFFQRPVDDVLAEIENRIAMGIQHFAFFDDALLTNAEKHLIPILETIILQKWTTFFHAPNGMHVGRISRDLADLMYRSGFRTIRLGVESLIPERQNELGAKLEIEQFQTAAENLHSAGFEYNQIGAYILYGLPGQDIREVLKTCQMVKQASVRPYLAEYSPLPGTALWPDALEHSPFDIASEPLYHNNTFFPCRTPEFTWDLVWQIKREALDR